MAEEGKEYRVYSKRKEGVFEKRTYYEGVVNARNKRDAISKISAGKNIPLKDLKAEPTAQDCFVASAVYGGIDFKQVKVLREYRDNVLMQDEIGRKFVGWYYAGGGERIASFIDKRARFLIPVIRKGLDIFVADYLLRKELES